MSSLHDLVESLAGKTSDEVADNGHDGSADIFEADYVEKLASAVEFILGDAPKAETPVAPTSAKKEDQADALAERLKARLQSKLTERKQSADADKEAVVTSIIDRLKGMQAQTDTPEVKNDTSDDSELFYSDKEEAHEDVEEKNESVEASADEDTETVAKAASAEQTLADVLAASLGANEPDESGADSDVKTAGVRGDVEPVAREEATSLLKQRLLAKVGKEV